MFEGPRVYRVAYLWRRWSAHVPEKRLHRRCWTLWGARRWARSVGG